MARDNLKQSVADLLGLRLAVGLANAKGLSALRWQPQGTLPGSLSGCHRGANLLAVANQSVGNPTADALFKFDTGGLAMPGGGI